MDAINRPEPFASAIPPADVIRADLARVNVEADLLRRQLRLALKRDREARRLAAEANELVGA